MELFAYKPNLGKSRKRLAKMDKKEIANSRLVRMTSLCGLLYMYIIGDVTINKL